MAHPELIVLSPDALKGRSLPLREAQARIGRAKDSNDLVLPVKGISSRHCLVYEYEGECYIRDLGSVNGTWVNGQKVESDRSLKDGDKIHIGPALLEYQASRGSGAARGEGAAGRKATALTRTAAPAEAPAGVKAPATVKADAVEDVTLPAPPPPAKRAPSPRVTPLPVAAPIPTAQPVRVSPPALTRDVKAEIHRRLVDDKDLKKKDFGRMSADEQRSAVRGVVERIVAEVGEKVPRSVDREVLIQEILEEALGLGPLEALLADDTVTEVIVNGFDRVFVERAGRIARSDRQFTDNAQVVNVVRRILAPLGRQINDASPLVDARLPDGSRVNAVIPPVAVSGPSLTIRKFPKRRMNYRDLLANGTLELRMLQFLELAVRERLNILVSGGTGSGKTTLLNVLSSFIPEHERVVTIEDVQELRLEHEDQVNLEARPANLEGEGEIPIRKLVINALRMRPDRIVVGECRGGEALDMLQAMNTGHDGSLTTIHANSPRDAVSRLETLVMMSGVELPSRAIREQIAAAIHLVVQQSRLSDGSRKVVSVTELTGMEGDRPTMQEIFAFRQTGIDGSGRVLGEHGPTGLVPRFIQKLRDKGVRTELEDLVQAQGTSSGAE